MLKNPERACDPLDRSSGSCRILKNPQVRGIQQGSSRGVAGGLVAGASNRGVVAGASNRASNRGLYGRPKCKRGDGLCGPVALNANSGPESGVGCSKCKRGAGFWVRLL